MKVLSVIEHVLDLESKSDGKTYEILQKFCRNSSTWVENT